MARKSIVNMSQLPTTSGITMSNPLTVTTTGVSREFYELGSADSVCFYYDITATAGGGTFQLALTERDPATGVFLTQTDLPAFASESGNVANVRTPTASTLWVPQGECYQLTWTLTTMTSCTFSVVAILNNSGG
jgi:hypothetical protein